MNQPFLRSVTLTVLCLAIAGCKDQGADASSTPFRIEPVTEDFSRISNPSERWAAYGLSSYVVEQTLLCFCNSEGARRIFVRDNVVVDVIRMSDGVSIFETQGTYHKTAPGLFNFAQSVDPDSVASLNLEYDARFGFPRLVYIDYDSRVADEEMGYRTENIQRVIW